MELYQVTVQKTQHGYLTTQSDFGIAIDADTIENAMSAMKNQIEQEGVLRLKNGESLPEAKLILEDGNTIYVSTDIKKKFKESATESVRKNISMPAWMDIQLRYYGVDASKLFQEAAITYLEKEENKNRKPITTINELKEHVSEDLLHQYADECIKEMLNKGGYNHEKTSLH